jgi:benzoyl-CoA reductase subunit B
MHNFGENKLMNLGGKSINQAERTAARDNAVTKQLQSSINSAAYQKEWFRNTRDKLRQGEPYVLAQADTPHEIFLTMDIPVIPVQWWSAIIAAKQLSPYYFDLMNEKGYARGLCRYCSLPLACTMDHNPEKAPWGGLPRPTLLLAELTCDSLAKIFELWAREYGCQFFPLEHTGSTLPNNRWWEQIKANWDKIVEPRRLNLRIAEIEQIIRYMEITTGKEFRRARVLKVMEMVNQQEEYFIKVRDLIAQTKPCPVSLPDQFASTMNPQWHRGTSWGVQQAKAFYEEVKARVNRGEAVCRDEKYRLMWIGAGLWHNTAFYRYFEEKYGAVFVCSIYLSIAADGYARDIKGDPVAALASRHLDMGEYLRQPEWLLKEAKLHDVSGAVMIISRSCIRDIGRRFIKLAFEKAGIPLLTIYADVVDAREWDDEKIKADVSSFIEKRVLKP